MTDFLKSSAAWSHDASYLPWSTSFSHGAAPAWAASSALPVPAKAVDAKKPVELRADTAATGPSMNPCRAASRVVGMRQRKTQPEGK